MRPCGRKSLFLLVLALSAALVSTPIHAQNTTYGQPLGTIYLSASPDAREGMISAVAFVPFDFFIVSEIDYADIGRPEVNDGGGLRAWEAGALFPSEVVITGAVLEPFDALSLGNPPSWIVGIPGIDVGITLRPQVLVRYTGLLVQSPAPTDLVLDLGPSNPTSFDHLPGPGWVDEPLIGDCTLQDGSPTKCKRLFANVFGMRVNCVAECTVKTETTSWGTVKANFGG